VNPQKDQAKVEEICQLIGEELSAYQIAEPFDKIISILDPKWVELIPASYVLDRQGKIGARIIGSRSIHNLENSIRVALGK
jgi:hypothetical protein